MVTNVAGVGLADVIDAAQVNHRADHCWQAKQDRGDVDGRVAALEARQWRFPDHDARLVFGEKAVDPLHCASEDRFVAGPSAREAVRAMLGLAAGLAHGPAGHRCKVEGEHRRGHFT
jgi:hypothetical protein